MPHAWIIEDEFPIARHIQGVLEEVGYDTFDLVATEREAVAAAVGAPAVARHLGRQTVGGVWPGGHRRDPRRRRGGPVNFIAASPEAARTCGFGARVFIKPVDNVSLARAARKQNLGSELATVVPAGPASPPPA